MDLVKIRNMGDKELEIYLKRLSNKRKRICYKCGKSDANYTINVQNKDKFQQKKLCSLCKECYNKMLSDFDIDDIIWD